MRTMYAEAEEESGSDIGLAPLFVLLAGLGALLWFTPDQPGLPSSWPSLDTLQQWLHSSSVPIEAIVPPVKLVGWAVWTWIALSLLLQLLVAFIEFATRSAAWTQQLRATANL